MPRANIIRKDLDYSFYHVYFRGVNKRTIFKDQKDKIVFLGLIKRYLGPPQNYTYYPNFEHEIELNAFCLMDNHVHFLIYQIEKGNLSKFMQSILVSYSMYFNSKYSRIGPLFESRYKASIIDSDSYLLHISRYIHLNPTNWQENSFSSLEAYLGNFKPKWLKISRVKNLFEGTDYLRFVKEYESSTKNKILEI